MMKCTIAAEFECAAGDFLIVHRDVVPPGGSGLDIKALYGADDDVGVALFAVVLTAGHKGEVCVAEVVVDRSAAALSTGQFDVIPFHVGGVAFGPGVLVTADNYRIIISPQTKYVVVGFHFLEDVVFGGEVEPGIVSFRDQYSYGGHKSLLQGLRVY